MVAVYWCHGLLTPGRHRRRKEGACYRNHRLHATVYMGQAIRNMGKGRGHPRWPKKYIPNSYIPDAVQEKVPESHVTIFPSRS